MSPPQNESGTLVKIRALLEGFFLSAIRFYTYNTPIAKGKYRLAQAAVRLCGHSAEPVEVPTKDGRTVWANPKSEVHFGVYFFGEYEKVLTRMMVSLMKKGDVCLDVGANFGWYTTLFAKHAGAEGSVHAFEPVPSTFEELRLNYELLGRPKNVFINRLALGNEHTEVTVNLFDGLGTGHASLSTRGREDFHSFQTKMVPLDSYLDEKRLGSVSLVKVDIEGAEMMFLKGAEKLFRQDIPPIILMEMVLQQTQSFGYLPNDLIEFIRARASYDFYKADEYNDKLTSIHGFTQNDIGANVICVPKTLAQGKPDLLAEWLS